MTVTEEDKEKALGLIRQAVVLREDLHDLEKTLSRIRNESGELIEKLGEVRDANQG